MNCLLKRIIPSCCILICTMVLQAQNLDNFYQFKSNTGFSSVQKILQDGAGNYYVAGTVYDSTDIGLAGSPYYIVPVALNTYCGYLAKYSSDLKLIWAYRLGGFSTFVISDMALSDNEGNIIIGGYFKGTTNFDIKNNGQPITPAGGADAFIAKYDTAMNFIYADKIGGAGDDYLHHLVLNTNGFIVASGTFDNNCDFDPSGNTWIAKGQGFSYNEFLGWYEIQNGALLTVDTFDNTTFDISAITADDNQNVYVLGSFDSFFDIDPGTTNTHATSTGGYDVVMAEFDYLGNLVWHEQIGGAGDDLAQVLKYVNGSLLVGIRFQHQVDFDPSASIQTFTSTSNGDAFIGRYDLSGNYQMGFALSTQAAGASGVEDITAWGNSYYVTGYYAGTCNFNPAGSNLLTSQQTTGYMASYNSQGGFEQVGGFTDYGTNSSSHISKIVSLPQGEHILVLGQASAEVAIDFNHPTDSINFTGDYQQFIGVYDFYEISPDTPATNLVFSNVTDSSMTVSFSGGSGAKRVVLAHKASAVDTVPTDGIYFSADTVFGMSYTQLGDSNFFVYNDTGTSFTITGLDSATVYYFAVFEYNGQSSAINYQTDHYLTGHQQTRPFADTDTTTTTAIIDIHKPVVSIWPNPATNLLYLQLGNRLASHAEVSVTDITGQIVTRQTATEGSETATLNIVSLASGIYLCNIKTDTNNQTIRFIKN